MTKTEKTISELLAEIGISHEKSKIAGVHNLYTSHGDLIDQMDAHFASNLYDCAQAAA